MIDSVDGVRLLSFNRNGKFYYEYLRRKKGELGDSDGGKPAEIEGIDFTDAWVRFSSSLSFLLSLFLIYYLYLIA